MFTTNSWNGEAVVEKQSIIITLDKIDQMLKISLKEAQSDEEIFFSMAWFDEVCADDELQSKKIINFRLGGRAHSLTLLEFARRLGLYHAEELEEEERFISKIAKKSRVLTEETIRSLSTPVYCRDLDMTNLRELIGSKDILIPEILVDDVPRLATQRAPRVQRASMQDLYERMGSMEIRQEAIERMKYRHAYHEDRYQGIFEHMARFYSVLLQGAYNPPSYAQP
ncbi:hypothetical protein Tco_1411948 [Tanacetum coccineum]